jgi:hypothetical protein
MIEYRLQKRFVTLPVRLCEDVIEVADRLMRMDAECKGDFGHGDSLSDER